MMPTMGLPHFRYGLKTPCRRAPLRRRTICFFMCLRDRFVSEFRNGTISFGAGEAFIVHAGETYMSLKNQDYLLCAVRMNFGFLLRCCDYERPSFYTESSGHRLVSHKGDSAGRQLAHKIAGLAHACFERRSSLHPADVSFL